MSHSPQRKEKDCLNCGTEVAGHYCQQCGQENIVPKENFWGLLTHFVYDITHFDGKFFSTLKLLIVKPGFISKEYLKGRRMSYLHPIRMYVFTSAFFFVLFFMMFNGKSIVTSEKEKVETEQAELKEAIADLQDQRERKLDSVENRAMLVALAKMKLKQAEVNAAYEEKWGVEAQRKAFGKNKFNPVKVTQKGKMIEIDNGDTVVQAPVKMGVSDFRLNTVKAYDYIQKELPKDRRDHWILRNFMVIAINATDEAQNDNKYVFLRNFVDTLLHNFPKMMFVSLPLFALILKILYLRRKDLLYTDHAIFTIHLYCATYIFMLAWFALQKLGDAYHLGFVDWILFFGVLGIFYYLYKSLRNFYQQGRGKTILKFVLLNILAFGMMVLLLLIFTTISAANLTAH